MASNEAALESASALMDGEGSDIDVARVLRASDSDDALRDYWLRQHRIRAAIQGNPQTAIDVSGSVRAALEGSPQQQRVQNPLVGLAVAASVTLAVVFGGQQLLVTEPSAPLAQVPGAVIPVSGGAPLQASFGSTPSVQDEAPAAVSLQASTISAYEQVARERLLRLGAQHAQSSAAIQPNPVVPFARVPKTNR